MPSIVVENICSLFKIGNILIILLIIVAIGLNIYLGIKRKPKFIDLKDLPSGGLNEAQKQAISMVTETNKFLISLSTLMFGAVGFYLTQYKEYFKTESIIKVAFLSSFIFLGLSYYFAFKAYAQSLSELAQDAIAMKPHKSDTLYYLEMQFWTSISASLILLSIFVFIVFYKFNN